MISLLSDCRYEVEVPGARKVSLRVLASGFPEEVILKLNSSRSKGQPREEGVTEYSRQRGLGEKDHDSVLDVVYMR